ncbi:MAG: peptidyl-prolyl cis-trans isomerase, partial [Anaerolineae bacterium]|nr:peptidyl-prolyl cis-trans isomerase [Anaerolineae bacterium]
MIEGWKQVLEDMRGALLGKTPEKKSPVVVIPEDSAEQKTPVIVEPADAPNQQAAETESPETLGTQPGIEPEVLAETLNDQTAVDFLSDHELTVMNNDSVVDIPTELSDEVIVINGETIYHLPREQVGPQRWMQVSFVVILVIAAAWFVVSSGLWARWTVPKAPTPNVVAAFDDGQITLADVDAHLTQLEGSEVGDLGHSPEEFLFVLEDIVMDRLVSQWAAERQPENEETFSHTMQHINEELNLQALEGQLHEGDIPVAESDIQAYYNDNRDLFGDQPLTAVREQIRQTLVAEKEQDYVTNYIEQLKENASVTRFFELLDVPAPTEDDLRRYYEENRDQFALPRQVVVDELQFVIGEDEVTARQAADDALLKLRSGAGFSDISSEIPAAVLTSEMTIFEGMRGDEWDTAVFALTDGELSDIFRADDAFYIVRLQEKQNARTQTFEEMRDLVETAVTPQVMDDWFAANANKTLFTLKSNRYTVGEFYQEYQEMPFTVQTQFAGPEGMKDLAERLIERLLLVADANERLLDVENQELTDEARLQILKQMLHQEEVDDKIE